jgi:hypothetical protein
MFSSDLNLDLEKVSGSGFKFQSMQGDELPFLEKGTRHRIRYYSRTGTVTGTGTQSDIQIPLKHV